jgi:hypothetical protein
MRGAGGHQGGGRGGGEEQGGQRRRLHLLPKLHCIALHYFLGLFLLLLVLQQYKHLLFLSVSSLCLEITV